MSTSGITQNELMESVNGFDEIAVEAHFGIDLYTGNEGHPMKVARAAVFINERHGGLSDTDAKSVAMRMSLKDIEGYFEPEPDDEIDPDAPDTVVGKGDSAPESEPVNSLASASPLESSPPSTSV